MTNITLSTPLVRLDPFTYPTNLSQVRQDLPDTSFAAEPSEELLAELGYAIVHPSMKPVGEVVEEDSPMLKSDGTWRQTWKTRDFTESEVAERFEGLRLAQLQAIKQLQVDALEQGCSYLFPDNYTGHVQLRDGDRANLSGLRLRAMAAKLANNGEVFSFRVFENITKTGLSADEIIVITDVAFERYTKTLGYCWYFKDLTEAATLAGGLPPIPPNPAALEQLILSS